MLVMPWCNIAVCCGGVRIVAAALCRCVDLCHLSQPASAATRVYVVSTGGTRCWLCMLEHKHFNKCASTAINLGLCPVPHR